MFVQEGGVACPYELLTFSEYTLMILTWLSAFYKI